MAGLLFVPTQQRLTQQSGLGDPIWLKFFQALTAVTPLNGTSQQMAAVPADKVPTGAFWFQTDRTVFYGFYDGAWRYLSGIMRAALADAPTNLGVNDVGFQLAVEDFGDLVVWSGSTWNMAPGATIPGLTWSSVTTPTTAPPASGWAPADGSTTTLLVTGPTLTAFTVTLPLSSGLFVKR